MTPQIHSTEDALALLQWYAEAGVDDAMEDSAVDYYALSQAESRPAPRPAAATRPAASAPALSPAAAPLPVTASAPAAAPAYTAKATASIVEEARALAASCDSLEALRKAVMGFDGCALKKLATNTVFADGNPEAKVMFIGEAPGADEDREGIPFCGASGQLLDRMLAAIGLDRKTNAYITNTIFWRPPGNRNPNEEELAICRPFVDKHIALLQPKLLVLVGGIATKSLLGTKNGITSLRQRQHQYQNPLMTSPVKTVALFHPSYLLRSPAQKAFAWQDLLQIKQLLEEES